MKNLILFLFFITLTNHVFAVCSSPISRTNNGTNSVLTSTKYNLDVNTVYNRANNLPGDCIVDDSMNGSKLIDGTVTAAKLGTGSVTTAKIADGAITAAKLAAAIENLVPVGTILSYGGTTAPSGYLLGQGQSLSRTTYASLYAVYGTAFGTADGNSFNNIDCRGRFLRYVDGGQNRDPDRASRTAMATGGNVGDNVGSVQDSVYASHRHYTVSGARNSTSTGSYLASSVTNFASDSNYSFRAALGSPEPSFYLSSASGGNETRPININVNCIVKY